MFTYDKRTFTELYLSKVFHFPSKFPGKNFLSIQVKMHRSWPLKKNKIKKKYAYKWFLKSILRNFIKLL